MKISRESRKLARELFRLACPQGRFDADRARTIAEGLVSSRPLDSYATLKEFTRLVRLELQKHHAVIESAASLTPTEQTKIEADVRSRFGSDLTTEFRVDSALIGGLRIQVGSDVWDGSVLARLEDLKQHI